MLKKYVVRLTDAEQALLKQVAGKFKGAAQKVRRAQVLLKADADGPGWTDAKTADAFGCRTRTVENIRERFVTEGFEIALNGQVRVKPPREKLLDGEQEAKVIAMRLSSPPPGFANWTLRLLAEQLMQTRRSNMSFRLLVGPYQLMGPMIAQVSARSSRA